MEQNAKPSKMQKYLRLIAKIHLTPAQSIVAGFALMILIGAVLLDIARTKAANRVKKG